MPRAALKPSDIAAFRARAAEAATRLFAADGYEAVTMRALADALGCSAMTPYRYLAGKDELFALVRAEAFRRFADRLEAAIARAGDPLAALRRLKRAYVAFAIDEADAYRVMYEQRQPPDHHRWPELDRESRRAFGCLVHAVERAIAAGALTGEPLTVAHLLWASTHGLVSLHLAGRFIAGRSLAQLAASDHELAGFLPAPRPRPRPRRRTQ
jgi:AcrR family transcriptional regulator